MQHLKSKQDTAGPCDSVKVSDGDVAMIVRKLNNRPRKCLGFRTPQQVFSGARRIALAT